MNSKFFYTIAFFILSAFAVAGQRNRIPAESPLEKLPQKPIDTLPTADPETRIILYSNNLWSYYRPGINTHSELEVYRQNWDTTQVFAYKNISYESLPQTVDLNLVGSLNEFSSPIAGKVLSKYGTRGRRNHNGVDVPLRIGEPIHAAFEGKVRYAKYNSGGFGYLVIIRHINGLETWHAHLTRLNVRVNDYVKCGQVIGFGGSTGRSRGPHLHFEIRYKDQSFDPEFIIDFEQGQLRYQTFALEKSFFNIHSRASEILEEGDEYDYPLLADQTPGDTTSADILDRIMAAQSGDNDKPKPAPASAGNAVYHTIKDGDMLGKLALKYGVKVSQICKLNNMTATTTLKLGKKLRIK